MISDAGPTEAYVWIWLPGATDPVVAGRLAEAGGQLIFNYGRSYLARPDAISLYDPELPLRAGIQRPRAGLSLPSCLRDAAPDAWGRRVIINRRLGSAGAGVDPGRFGELLYLLESGSDRIGALDVQAGATRYVARDAPAASLEDLQHAADLVERGAVLAPDLAAALLHGTSIGGARPKAAIVSGGQSFIAKFSLRSDLYGVVEAEYVAMRLAAEIGLQAAPVQLIRTAGRSVLLVERFDREHTARGRLRHGVVSGLTLLGLDEMMARYASYEDLATIIRHRFAAPKAALRELFGRLVFHVLCGNTDDHARNHAAFWNGRDLALTPAYDICPVPRAGGEATQAMRILGDESFSRIELCLRAASAHLLAPDEATSLVLHQIAVIKRRWPALCAEAGTSEVDRALMWRRAWFNPSVFEGAPAAVAEAADA